MKLPNDRYIIYFIIIIGIIGFIFYGAKIGLFQGAPSPYKVIETVHLGTIPAQQSGRIEPYICPQESSDGIVLDRCSIYGSGYFSELNPNNKWNGVCRYQETKDKYIYCCLGDLAYSNTGIPIDCCKEGTVITGEGGSQHCGQPGPMADGIGGLSNAETKILTDLKEAFIKCPDGSWNYRSLCETTTTTSTVSTTTTTIDDEIPIGFSGRVIDNETKEGIGNAKILYNDKVIATTGTKGVTIGYYDVSNFEEGEYEITASADEYESQTKSLINDIYTEEELDFELQPEESDEIIGIIIAGILITISIILVVIFVFFRKGRR